jgi:hypothetical protein
MRVTKQVIPFAISIAWVALVVLPAAANTQLKTVNHVDETYTETVACPFDISVHVSGSFKVVDYYDNTGFLYKTIATPGGGPFTVTSTAHGTTLTQQSEA